MKDSFIFRKEWRDAICELPEKVRAEVYVAIIEYGLTGETPELKSIARMAFNFLKAEIDKEEAEEAHRAHVSKVRSEAGKRSAEARKESFVGTKNNFVGTKVEQNSNKSLTNLQQNSTNSEQNPTPTTSLINKIKEENINNKDNISKNNKKKKEESKKKKEERAEKLKVRQEAFYNSLVPFIEGHGGEYSPKMVREFFNYWSEPNATMYKMRFEMQKTWELSRRLATWASKNTEFKTNNNENYNRNAADKRRGYDAVVHEAEDYEKDF